MINTLILFSSILFFFYFTSFRILFVIMRFLLWFAYRKTAITVSLERNLHISLEHDVPFVYGEHNNKQALL